MEEVVENKFKEIFGIEGRIKTYSIPYSNDNGVYATTRIREDNIINLYSMNFEELGIITMNMENVSSYADIENWTRDIRKAISKLLQKGYVLQHGFDIVYNDKMPRYSEQIDLKSKIDQVTLEALNDMFKLKIDFEALKDDK